ncbi:hypothetical protein ACFRKB_26525 [Streptomyces scopuliridis]
MYEKADCGRLAWFTVKFAAGSAEVTVSGAAVAPSVCTGVWTSTR